MTVPRTTLRHWLALVGVALLLPLASASCEGDGVAAQEGELRTRPLGPEPVGDPARYPIILAHGFNASPENLGFYRLADELRDDQHRIYEAEVAPYDGVRVRATQLAAVVDQALADGAEKVNIIAHSMGGLDSRYLASPEGLDYGDVVASITTISTPHRGSAAADVLLDVLDGLAVADEDINGLVSAFGAHWSTVAGDSKFREALRAISEEHTVAFNDAITDHPSTYYQSWAGVSSVAAVKNPRDPEECGWVLGDYARADGMDLTLWKSAAFVSHGDLDPNDGLVTVESARWGEFRGCIPADHADEIGQFLDRKADFWTGFDHVRFYRNLVFELAAQGY
jgi:triacylglycerol lipase